ncbi:MULTISPECIES: efflux RND transporter permease subunit [unclassified Sphingomonas]|jgi:multidrug efflux pump subunit AcrB|uniref:efflux RND transporter permease subunit n=1 Tax=unclassified Sphingomonas TaxID=196159 RepID=UPI0007DA0017|nr:MULTISPECIES: efflux RND transporter permease subunit [unclassified Sphingomonas]MBI0533486.1 efflux RND transporter permease subunit [Sphingomonas sp. TX0522]OAN65051.1 transporter [Sphingomonas sp. TDK1]
MSVLSRHANALILAALIIVAGGAAAALRIPVSLFPFINYPRVVVAVDAGERDPAQMAAQITRPIEIALRGVPGVTHVRSTTSRGSAEVALSFPWGQDMAGATMATQGALATVLPDLPAGARFEVRRSDPTLFPVLGVALTSSSLDPQALRQLADLKVRPALLAVSGVAGVDVLGGSAREFAVDVDPAHATALGLSLADVATAIGKDNAVQGVGRLEDRHRLYLVLAENRLGSIADLAATPVKAGQTAAAGIVTLGQIATITPSVAPSYTRITADGKSAVLVNVRQSLTGDTVGIVRETAARLKTLGLPPSVTVTPFYDQSELVTGAANAVRDAILLGAVLAGVVLFVFLRSARLMLITGLMLPAVLAGTCLVLLALGMSFNMMTLGGLAAAVGLVVDDAVVMLEHIMRRLQEGQASDRRSILDAAAEMTRPLVGSTTATMVVFLPLAFVTGVTGGFFKALALTMVAALGLSLLFTRFVLPIAAARWVGAREAEAAERAGGVLARLGRSYEWSADRAFGRPAMFAAVVALVFVAAGWLAWRHVPSGFMPAMDEGGFILDYKAQPGAALSDTDRLLRQVERIIVATPEVASYSRRTGAQLGGGLSEADEGDYFVRLKGGSRRPIDAVMADIRQKIDTDVPGLQVETAQLMEDLIGDLTAVPQPIEVKLFGDDPAVLATAAKQVGDAIGRISGVVEVVDGLRVAGDTVSIAVNPQLALQQGLDPTGVAGQLETLIGGTQATQVRIGEQLVTVRVRAPQALRSRADEIARLPLVAPDGHLVRVGQVATVSIVGGQKQLTREDLAPFVAVTARLEGRDLGSAMTEVRKTVANLKLPADVRVDYGGLYTQQKQSFADLTLVFVAALLLVALLITFLFEQPMWTIAAVGTVLLSAAAVLIGLWVTGIELNISALMGLTMVVGMVTELVIFLLAELDPSNPLDAAGLREAAGKRLRPIVMSALIAILTLSPLALGLSRGAGLQQPLATAIIFGLTAAVPLVLLFLPAALLALRSRKNGAVTAP